MITNIFIVNTTLVQPVTLTIDQACQRHLGLEPSTLNIMVLQQKIRAQKVGKRWHIPVAELDRVFLGVKDKSR